MNKKEFASKYCTKCGTQRCEGVNSEWVDGCKHWKKEMGSLNLVDKAMDNKGISEIIHEVSIVNAMLDFYTVEYNNKKNEDALCELLKDGFVFSFLPSGGYALTTLKDFVNFESMNEEVEC